MNETVIELSLNITAVIWFIITLSRLKPKKLSDVVGIFLIYLLMASVIYKTISNILILTGHP